MKISNPITVVFGLAVLIALTYIGFGATNHQNTAQAESKESKWTTSSNVSLDTDKAKLGYTIGYNIANDILRNQMQDKIDTQAFIAAQRDILGGGESRMTLEEMQQAQQTFQLQQQQEYAALAASNKEKSTAFLEKNKAGDGILVTESGLQYQIIREGKGKQPTQENTVTVHYLGALIDGTPFDSSYARNQPADFPVTGVIPGFAEGLQLMKEGAKYRFVIPPELAYGENAPANIGPNQVLVFEVELIAIK